MTRDADREPGSIPDQQLFAGLRAMWQRRDPPPDGLVSSVILAIAARDLADEVEMLTLVDSTERLAGVRGSSDARTLTFSSDPVTVMLRVSDLADGRRRLDGWVSPPSAHGLRLRCAGVELRTTSTANGRFEFAAIRAGSATLSIETQPVGGAGSGTLLRLETPPFTM